MPDIFFSVIIPTYNRAAFLPKTVQSVLNQTYPHYEVIIVDDGSTDDTAQVVQPLLSDRVFYFRKENAERAAARNFGTRQSGGDYITFLDSDDLLYPDYLQNARESIRKYNDPSFLHLGYAITDENGHPKVKVDSLPTDDISIFIKGNPLSCMGIFLRKDISRQFYFNEDRQLSGSEDWELWIRVAAQAGIKTDNRISAALIDHDSRSVQHFSKDKLVQRKELALRYAFADQAVREKFGLHRRQITAYWDSYIALHLVLSGCTKAGLRFWLYSVRACPPSIFERRTLAIIKHALRGFISGRKPG